MAFNFPFSTLHELNLDWILEQVKKLINNNEEFLQKADTAVETANEAVETAGEAITIAEQAAQAQIGDGAVTTVKLADNAVTAEKIRNGAVTYNKLAANAKFIYPKLKKWNTETNGKVIFLGNSYGYNDNYPDITKWPVHVANILNMGTVDVGWFNLCRASYSLVGVNGSARFLDVLESWYDSYSSTAPEIGAIIVIGGINDARSARYGEVETAFQEMADYIKLNFPNAVMYNGYCGWIDESRKASSDTHGNASYRFEVAKRYMSAGRYGWNYLSGIENVFHNKTEMIDYIHPNNEGELKIGLAVASALVTGSCASAKRAETNIAVTPATITDYTVTVHNGYLLQWLVDNVIQTRWNSLEFDISPAMPMQINTVYTLGYVDLPLSNDVDFGNIAMFIRTDTDNTGVTQMVARVYLTSATDASGRIAINFQIKGFSDGSNSKNVTRLVRFVYDTYKLTIND